MNKNYISPENFSALSPEERKILKNVIDNKTTASDNTETV